MEKQAGKFIVDVYPITPLSLARQQFYSYLWDTEIPRGTLVSIPFFRQNIEGIVINNRSDFHRFGNIRLKKINKIIEESFLTDNQLQLAEFISQYYLSPVGTVLKFFAPKRTKARKSNNEPKTINHRVRKIKLTNEQQNAVKQITGTRQSKAKNYLLFGPASSGKTEVYINAIAKLKKGNGKIQFLVLLPELTLTPQAIERYGEYFNPEEIAVLHSKISKGQLYANWQKIKSGSAKIIIGTRMAVFAPFNKLGLIVVDEEQDMSHKQWDMSPRYDARTVGEKLAEMHGAKLIFGSATPSIDLFHKALEKKCKLLKLSQLPGISNPEVELVNMRKEKWQKNFSPISKKLQAEIKFALKYKLQTILFINRQGMGSFSICTNCKNVLRCPRCERALIYAKSGDYKCLHCNYVSGAIIECPKCKNATFKNIGLGTQKIESEIQKLFPGARSGMADSDSMKIAGKQQEKLYRKFADREIDILVGTQMITKGWDLPNVGLVGIMDADSLFNLPDFRSNEKAFQLLAQVAGRTNRPGHRFPGKVIVQTFNPDNTILRHLAEMDYERMFTAELEERMILHYPPFGRIIKLIHRNKDREKLEQVAKKTYDELKRTTEKDLVIKITKPQNPLVPKTRDHFKKQIVIRLTGDVSDIPPKIRKALEKLNSSWVIDIDPISIL